MNIVALTTCYNRKELTLRALSSLFAQTLPAGFHIEVWLVDDGSSDGTGAAVRSFFPSVAVLDGTGDLYWAGGMRFGWDRIVKNCSVDYLLVFNDDISLYPSAVSRLLATANDLHASGCDAFAVAGAFNDHVLGAVAYGGVVRNSCWHPLRFRKLTPGGTGQECDTLNMNLALISKGALRQIGFLSPEFTHAKADYDFGLRLRAAGGRIVLAPGYMGECSRRELSNIPHGGSLSFSFAERWRRLTSVKMQPPRQRAVYCRRHAGIFWPMFWVLPYVREFFRFKI